ncbi:CAP domain-containing protein [Butyricicoccus sp. OF10-2]|uniref:CAP domain-containing protein n=1 Tax=Butyricicoccus sp. OF10-2 TaxID=2292298 RepID=UPI001314A3B0|nr:CAP domain-containing protein [Butyricicoccus sp. OF10-2]
MSNVAIALCCIVISNALTQAGGITHYVPAPIDSSYESPGAIENFESQQQTMIDCINNERENVNLSPVYVNGALSEVAQVRLQEIMVSFSHERPDGSTKTELLEETGVSLSNYMSENIISGTAESTPESLMKSFMTSSVHRAWILSDEVNAVGVAIGRNEYNQIYAVQIFGRF